MLTPSTIIVPGATATPSHLAELNREKDASRFDTEKLQKISIEGLTCAQVEEYFAEAIKEGKINRKDDEDSVIAPVLKKEKSEGSQPTRTVMDSFIVNDQTKLNNEKGNCVDASKNTMKSIPSTIIEEGDNDEQPPSFKGRDPASDILFDFNIDINFWRSMTALGLCFGAGCLYMLSRATKPILKS